MRLILEVSKSEYESYNKGAFDENASPEDKELYNTVALAIEKAVLAGQMEGLPLESPVLIKPE
jgi:hypothetical protein